MSNNNQTPKLVPPKTTTPSGEIGLGRTTVKPTNLKSPKTS